jgi:hypothetical protein
MKMANEIVRTTTIHKIVRQDGELVAVPDYSYDHAFHWNPDEEIFEIWTEGDVCVDDGIYTYGVFEFDLNVEEAKRLHGALGQWLNEHGSS